jgi:hypothetical protein
MKTRAAAVYIAQCIWFVMEKSNRTSDGAMPVVWFFCHDQAAEWALRHPGCWLEPGKTHARVDLDGPTAVLSSLVRSAASPTR